jgi:Flp pilus assembly protein TadG
VTMVEFALLAPLFLLLLFGVVVAGVMINAQIQLSNAVRDGVRAAAVCGDSFYNTAYGPGATVPALQLPNGQDCSDANVSAYVSSLISRIPGGGKMTSGPNLTVYNLTNTQVVPPAGETTMQVCQAGYKIEVSVKYAQPMFLPLISTIFADKGTTSRTLEADAQTTCEN